MKQSKFTHDLLNSEIFNLPVTASHFNAFKIYLLSDSEGYFFSDHHMMEIQSSKGQPLVQHPHHRNLVENYIYKPKPISAVSDAYQVYQEYQLQQSRGTTTCITPP